MVVPVYPRTVTLGVYGMLYPVLVPAYRSALEFPYLWSAKLCDGIV